MILKTVKTSRLTISVIPAKAPNPAALLLGLMIPPSCRGRLARAYRLVGRVPIYIGIQHADTEIVSGKARNHNFTL